MNGHDTAQSISSRREMMAMGALALVAAGTAGAQTDPAVAKPASPAQAARERQLREDFPWLARYAADNARLKAAGARPAVVLMGDSITERWQRLRPAFFAEGRVCRGIGGQTTPQMVLRMMPDVVALRPGTVHILGGTNDVAGNTGAMTIEQSRDNVEAMVLIAKASGLAVLLGAVPPAAAFHWSPDKRPAEPIRALNALLHDVAARHGATWIDYHAALADRDGAMREGLSSDGVHPTPACYAVMERMLEPLLARGERARG